MRRGDGPDRWRFGSIRARITLIAAGAVFVVLATAAVLLVSTQRSGLVDQLDDSLEADAERIAASVDASGDGAAVIDDDDRLVVVRRDGELVPTGPFDGDEFDGDEFDGDELDGDGFDGDEFDGDGHRVARAESGTVEVVVAASTEDVDETVSDLIRSLAFIVPAATALLAAVVWLLVGRTLRPVERIRVDVASIGAGDLHRRVPEPGGGDEIARLASTMNGMLDRLDRANQRQQRFVADASHELRTPVARMRAHLEVERRHADPAAGAPVEHDLLDDVAELQHLIDDLLVVAHGDADAPIVRRLVDLDVLVLDEARAVEGIDVRAVSAAQVHGDPAALRRVIRNLFDNARRHATATVAATLGEIGDRAVFVVDDDGPGIAPEHRLEVFERFTRLDDARTPAGRSGLGLAIVHTIVVQHDGTIELGDSPLGGARFTVALPLGPPPPPT